MQAETPARPAVGIIFDCDLGNSIDDALALALLYGLDGKNEARVVSVSVSKPNLKAAALAEAIGRFYAGAVSGAFNAPGRNLPVGLATEGKHPDDTPMLTAPLEKRNAEGQPVYVHGVQVLNDTADPTPVIRNALTAQHDQNAIVILTGPASNLVKVLDLPGAKELIASKVRYLSMMGGAYPEGGPEFNIETDIPAAKKLFAEWPTPIVASGYEVGEKLLYPASSIETDFAWTENHPVVDAYRAYKPMPYDAETWDMTAVLYAIRPDAGHFELSEPGTIRVHEDGRTSFEPAPEGKHRYLILDPSKADGIIQTFRELASARPVPRQPRRRRPQQQQQQQQQQQAPPPKPPEAKPQAPPR
jgi:inosine-uridine nucleoside N-ribohydrolase